MGILLLAIAVLPAIVLMLVIYKCDKVEPEPIGLVIGMMGLGVASIVPTVICELVADVILNVIFNPESVIYMFLSAFFGVALIEEFWKLFVVRIFIWKNKAFNYRFDAIVYCVASSLGFALLENILYVFQNGFLTGISRAILSVPGHCTFAVFMGYFLGNAKLYEMRGEKGKSILWFVLALIIPMLQHGFFDFCLFMDSGILFLIFLLFVVVCDVFAIVRIIRSEKQDIPFYVLKEGDLWIQNPVWMQMAATAMNVQMPNIQYDTNDNKK